MKNFRRSLRYVWPYRARLALAMLCAVLIAALWGGGLGALLPGMKVLISDEGLHGWAYGTIAGRRLGVRLASQSLPPGATIPFGQRRQVVKSVMSVVEVRPAGPAEGLLAVNDWLVGLGGGDAQPVLLPADLLAQRIAEQADGREVRLLVYSPMRRVSREVRVLPQPGDLGARVLAAVARFVPRAPTYRERFGTLLWLLGFAIVITALRDVLRFLEEYLAGTAVWRGILDLRCENYNVVLRLPTTFFSEQGVSDSMSRFLQDTAELARGQQTLFGRTIVEPGKAVGALVMALIFSWRLTLLALVAGPPAFLLIRAFSRRMRKASRRALESFSEMLGVLEETLTGIRVVKAYTMEAAERRRFLRVNRRLFRQQRRMVRIDAATAPAVEALGIVSAMAAVALAGYWVFQGAMDRERFLSLMACLAAMFDPVRKLAKVPARFQRAEAAAKRIFDLQDQPQERHLPGAPPLPRHRRSLCFRDVSFRYPQASQPALSDINLEIAAGETVAIVGPNGSGKTTLVSLVPRLLEPTTGAVLIDGRDVRRYSLRSLRRQIALVAQEAVVFNASIAENIAYGKRRARREEIEAAARQAYVDEFVSELPDGYDTVVGERGATLSGGQRQRIAIARAILRDPAILIFDEAMSQVDPDSEAKIHRALAEFRRGRTTLLIAHRFATVLEARRIVVLEAGRIVDVGPHAALLERCRLYRQLYDTQLAGPGASGAS